MHSFDRRHHCAAAILTGLVLPMVAAAAPDTKTEAAVASRELQMGPNGGVIVGEGEFVCSVYDLEQKRCLIKAPTEQEIIEAKQRGESGAASGPRQVQGLIEESLSAEELPIVECLKETPLADPLHTWSSYVRADVLWELCSLVAASRGMENAPSTEAQVAASRLRHQLEVLAGTSVIYAFEHDGEWPASLDVLTPNYLLELPQPDGISIMSFSVEEVRGNPVLMVHLSAAADELCRAFNSKADNPWLVVPDSDAKLPDFQTFCLKAEGGGYNILYRF